MSIVPDTHLIGLDWGTTQLRAYRFIAGGEVVESRQLPAGIQRIAAGDFERAFEDACGDWRAAAPASPILACGMIGSAQGWREAPYIDIPTSLDALGHVLTDVQTASGATLHIVPGLIVRAGLPDVLRGEETQVAGALDGGLDGDATPSPAGGDRWIALPGTHTKWVRVRDRNIVQFHTFMTGEVFAALCDHTILGRTMRRRPAADTPDSDRPAFDRAAFDLGVELARSPHARAGVLSTIFSTRTLGLVGALAPEAQADYLSGLLIGHELAGLGALGVGDLGRIGEAGDAGVPRGTGGIGDPAAHETPILLVGSDELCRRYQRALAAFGCTAAIAANATERGLWRVAQSAGLVRHAG